MSSYNRFCGGIIPLVSVFALAMTPVSLLADGAARDLPDCYDPGNALTVSIAIQVPSGTSAVGLEDSPPTGWTVSNISNSGVFDALNNKVKWGPFFEPFPEAVTYDATPPITETGTKCFTGTVSFDGINQPVTGDECILEPGPCDDGDYCTENDVCTNGVCAGTAIPGCGETTVVYDFSTNGGLDRFAFGTYTNSWIEDLEGIRRQCPEVCTEVTTITPDAYDRLALSDATGGDTDPNRYVNPDPVGQQDESTLVVEFNIAEDPSDVLQIDVLWEGYGDVAHHMELYIWDYVQGNWGNGAGLYGENNFMDDGSGDADFVLSGSVTTDITNYISATGEITLLVYDDQRSEDTFHDYVRVALTVPADCNNNGVPDNLDIAQGTSQDCNANTIPDECDIAGGTSEDCNTNAIPDECDIAGGTSSDANTNGIPDECEGCTSDPDCDDGLYCNGAETCDTNGVCQSGTAVDCDDSVGCTDDSCDEVNDQCVNAPNNALCDNGDLCDGTEACDPVLDCQAGTPLDCNDGVGCTTDTCEPATGCVNAASNGLCDNGQFCDGVETCDPLLDCQAGVPIDCNDSVGCTVDSCDEINDVCVNAASNGLCDNGDYCDGVEACDPLLDCQAGTPVDCSDSIGCTVDSCDEVNDVCVNAASNGLCDNGEFCDGVETCDPLLDCQVGVPIDCNDSVGCTVDSCDEVNDVCVNAASNGLCDNGDYCDGVEACDPLLDCQAGTPVDCSDSIGCTVDSCDEVNDVCVNAASNGLCDNGEFCDGVETCDPLLDCQVGVPIDCNDSVGCTVDSCDEVNDVCVNAASNGLCDNGDYCDGVEACDPLLDCQAGVPIDCSDSVGCTVDSCDEIDDVCVNAASNGLCDNGQFCDGIETCDPLLDCQASTPVDCDDGVGCTVDWCDEVNDQCVNAPSNGLCDNDQFCDGVETCDPLLDCQPGTAIDCADGVGCTVDSCDEVNDVCVNAASNGLCDNAQFCDGIETCDPLLDCQAGVPVDCDDSVGCTVDSCDEVNDVCVNAASNGLCDNGGFCDGVETCDPLLDCQVGVPIDCNDSVGCTVDSCDEVNDVCVNAASNGLCDNGQFCDGIETCDPLLDCQAGVPVDCNDSVGCTVDSCDEINDVCVNAASNGLCDNAQFCDGIETCDPLLDCQAGFCDGAETCDPLPDFAGWLPCLTGPDVVLSGGCEDMDLDADDDVDLADFAAMQQRFPSGCQAGTPVDCDDGVACTFDMCNEADDMCLNTPNNGLCADSNVCTIDTCDPVNGCDNDGTGITIPCDDGDPCTTNGVCQGDPAGTCLGTAVLYIENLEVFYAGRFADEPDPSRLFLATGSTATNDNVTNYVSGITGIRVFFDDLVQFSAAPADAFAFEWTTTTGTTFSPVPNVAEKISVTDAVEAGRSVVTIISSNGYVEKRWLKVTLDSTQVSTNGCELDGDLSGNPVVLPGGDGTPGGDTVFYVGNLPGEVNGDRKTTLTDVGLVRLEVNPFLPVPITNIYDVDKDGKVLLTDFGETRLAVNPFFTLPLIAP